MSKILASPVTENFSVLTPDVPRTLMEGGNQSVQLVTIPLDLDYNQIKGVVLKDMHLLKKNVNKYVDSKTHICEKSRCFSVLMK